MMMAAWSVSLCLLHVGYHCTAGRRLGVYMYCACVLIVTACVCCVVLILMHLIVLPDSVQSLTPESLTESQSLTPGTTTHHQQAAR